MAKAGAPPECADRPTSHKSAGPPNQKSVSENGHAKRAGLQAEVGSGGGGAGRSAGKQRRRRRRRRGRRRTTGKSLRVSPHHCSTAWLETGQKMDTTHTTKGGGEKDGDEGRREPQISGSPQCSIAPHTLFNIGCWLTAHREKKTRRRRAEVRKRRGGAFGR